MEFYQLNITGFFVSDVTKSKRIQKDEFSRKLIKLRIIFDRILVLEHFGSSLQGIL